MPPYCCAILREPGGALLLEARPPDAAVAAGELTCFGGKREAGEDPADCVARECREELAFTLQSPSRAVDLYVDGELIAWFYEAGAPPREAARAKEAGRRAVWLDGASLRSAVEGAAASPRRVSVDGAMLSPWHECVLRAHAAGLSRADFVSPRPRRETEGSC